jgi:uncharacterized surface protein with fasciclin (FAS1) repeats
MNGIRAIFLTAAACLAFAGAAVAKPDTGPRFQPGDATIADTAIAINAETGEFSTLIAALVCTGLVDAVADPDTRLTVFAPTDAAFAELNLSAGTICDAFPPEVLTNILLYHVTEGQRVSPSVINGRNKRIKMLAGGFIFPAGSGSVALEANNSEGMIVIPDVLASNGVIHAIDFVLLP